MDLYAKAFSKARLARWPTTNTVIVIVELDIVTTDRKYSDQVLVSCLASIIGLHPLLSPPGFGNLRLRTRTMVPATVESL